MLGYPLGKWEPLESLGIVAGMSSKGIETMAVWAVLTATSPAEHMWALICQGGLPFVAAANLLMPERLGGYWTLQQQSGSCMPLQASCCRQGCPGRQLAPGTPLAAYLQGILRGTPEQAML